MKYVRRIIDQEIDRKILAFNAINITGPKGCGKTRTAKERCTTVIEFQDEEKRDGYLAVAETSPKLFLNNKKPILFDEWQDAVKIWGTIRKACDDAPEETGSYYLTGSTSKDFDTPHTGTGRITGITMYPMTLYETGESNGTISLSRLFKTGVMPDNGCESSLSIDDLIFAACRGGWPSSLQKRSRKAQLLVAQSYFEGLCREDVSNLDGTRRDEAATRLLLRSYARNISTLASNRAVIRDINANYDMGDTMFYDYVKALKKLYVIQDVEAWSPAIRSKSAIQASDKKEFVDPSLVVAALGVNPDYFNLDLKTFGFIFETLCIRDLKIYSSALGGKVSYYHDRYGLEADAVLHLRDGRYALIEFKLRSTDIDEGAEHLLEIERLVAAYNEKETQAKLRAPDLKIVITGTQYGYQRPDGVFVIPIGTLRD